MSTSLLGPGDGNGASRLSRRAMQTLQHLCQGSSEKEVAKALGISAHTVHAYVKELHRKWGVSSRGELLSKAYLLMKPAARGKKSDVSEGIDRPFAADAEGGAHQRQKQILNRLEGFAPSKNSSGSFCLSEPRRSRAMRDAIDRDTQIFLLLATAKVAELLHELCSRFPADIFKERTNRSR